MGKKKRPGIEDEKLKSFLGHTPLEVLGGAVFGCFCGTGFRRVLGL